MTRTKKFWDKIAQKYAKRPIQDPDSYARTLDRTRSYLKPTDAVLELGCGTGMTALTLSECVDHITASDLSSGMIDIANERAEQSGRSNASFVRAGVFDPAIENRSYDAVMAFNLLHLLEDTAKALDRVRDLLKPDGVFISKTPCEPEKGAPLSYRLIRAILPILQFLGKAPYVKFMKTAELEEVVAARGFRIIEVGSYPVSPPSRYIVAQRISI